MTLSEFLAARLDEKAEMTEIHVERRSVPGRLRYFAAKLREGGHESAVALALEVMAEESGEVVGYTVLCDEVRPGGEPEVTIELWPETLYQDAAQAQREAQRAQAHADLDADLTGRHSAYSIAEVRRVKGAP